MNYLTCFFNEDKRKMLNQYFYNNKRILIDYPFAIQRFQILYYY